jgi:hypothetical protein
MADNVSVSSGSYTTTIRTKDNAGVQLQLLGIADSTGANVLAIDATGRLPALITQNSIRVATTFIRPADTNPYAVHDSVADSATAPTILTFAGMGRVNGAAGHICKAQLLTDQPANIAQFRLHLFNVAPTAINDNAPYAALWANRASRVGTLDFPALSTEGTGSTAAFAQWVDIPLFYVCATADTALYGLLETKTVFTPASGQNFYLALTAQQL